MTSIDNLFRLALVLCWLLPVRLPAATSTYEQEMAEALVQRIEQGEIVWFTDGGDRFPGIYHQHLLEHAQGAALILHGMGGHPDWPEVITPLRLNLPVSGWTTLSIQMPLLEPGAALSGYGETMSLASNRIRSAIRYLRDKKFLNIVIIGHSFGAITGAHYLAGAGTGVQAFIGISMQGFDFLNPRLDLNAYLARIDIPILDLYGSRDFSEVLSQSEERRLEAGKMNRQYYQQITIDGADHYFTGLEDVMIRRIRGWLDIAAPGVQEIADDKLNDRIESDSTEKSDKQ